MDDVKMPTEEPNFLDSLVPGSLNYGNMSSNVPLDNSDLVSEMIVFLAVSIKMLLIMSISLKKNLFFLFPGLFDWFIDCHHIMGCVYIIL